MLPRLYDERSRVRHALASMGSVLVTNSAVEAAPAAFLRGLFHSDGCRARNWTQKMIGGELKRYDYPRWQFTNVSADIRELCCWALDLVEVPWRQSNWKTISVSTRAGVARLDELIGLKS